MAHSYLSKSYTSKIKCLTLCTNISQFFCQYLFMYILISVIDMLLGVVKAFQS